MRRMVILLWHVHTHKRVVGKPAMCNVRHGALCRWSMALAAGSNLGNSPWMASCC